MRKHFSIPLFVAALAFCATRIAGSNPEVLKEDRVIILIDLDAIQRRVTIPVGENFPQIVVDQGRAYLYWGVEITNPDSETNAFQVYEETTMRIIQ